MPKVDPRDFLLNTDYGMDKIIVAKEGKIMPNETKLIPHGLPFTPLMFGCCSFNGDDSDSRSIPFSDDFFVTTSSGGGMISARVSITVAADATNIELVYHNEQANPQPLAYRLYGFEPPQINAKVAGTSKQARKFNLDTDRNYLKIYKVGKVRFGQKVEIVHNFGYIPQIMAWFSWGNFAPGRIQQHTSDNMTSLYPAIKVTTEKVIIDMTQFSPALANAEYYYRIYYDEA